ncbi:MAG: transcriptional regulator [Rhodospirillaceae bacterium]|nr:transcriptional regulator [Rhodospirillaceae bacterium]|tara:strand:- start:2405 stop:3517 length:1113 start_codon:yes stop_codon:yes gene_type:complete
MNFKVPLIDLKQRYEEEKEELLLCVERVLEKGNFVLTPEVTAFEQKAAEYIGAKHCIGLNSGTDALMMGLMAMGIGKGDEVITSPISFIASTAAIAHVGAIPVYADVRDDQNIDPSEIESKITSKTKAIMPIHWTGRISEMQTINAIASKNNLLVIEDSCQSIGAKYHGQHAGTFGTVGTFSAHPLKALNAIGDAGFLVTDNDTIAEKVRIYRNHGLVDRDTCVEFGVNSRLDALHAEILIYRLEKLESILKRRRKNVNLYRELITRPEIYIPQCKSHEENPFVMFLIQAKRRDSLKEFLAKRKIQTLVYYAKPLHLHPATKRYNYGLGDFPNAEKQADSVLALPHHQNLSVDQITFVAKSINDFYELSS